MQKDINLIFNYSDLPEAVNQLGKLAYWKRQVLDNRKLPPKDQINVIQPKIFPLKFLTKFDGTAEELHFISASQARLFSNQNLSKLQEISYYTKECKQAKEGLCLWRRQASVTDNDIEKGGKSFSLLSNIKSLSFRYIGGTDKKPDWKTQWKPLSSINSPKLLPHAIEINLEVENKKKVLKFHRLALLHHPDVFVPEIKIPKINSTTPPKLSNP